MPEISKRIYIPIPTLPHESIPLRLVYLSKSLTRIINVGEIELQLTTDLAREYSQPTNTNGWYQRLLTRIAEWSARVGVVGLGYVGLPLAIEWVRAGFLVTGIDIDPACVDMYASII